MSTDETRILGPLRVWRTASEEETRDLGRTIAQEVPADAVLLLEGDMGSGKTVFVQGLAAGMGIEAREVQSPTYTLVHEHQGGSRRLFHLDLYRLEEEDLGSFGLGEILAETAVKAVEWAERLPAEYRTGQRFVFKRCEGDERRIEEWEVRAAADPRVPREQGGNR